MKLLNNKNFKIFISNKYNYIFNKKNGQFCRWGKTKEDDPLFSPFGPEILDLEISKGKCLGNCEFCYKCNGNNNPVNNLSFIDFKKIIKKMPKILTQIAFGITDIYANPDFFKMIRYSRKKGIIPNYTTHGLDVDDYAVKQTAKFCGAVAVSLVNKEKSYNAIKKFTDAGMNQVNIHFMLSKETFSNAFSLIEDIKSDERLKKLNAVVFLGYKHKNFNSLHNSIPNVTKYKKLIEACNKNKIRYGFDSCSCPLYFKSIEEKENNKNLSIFAEPCESGLFSSYINCEGEFYPCSFSEGEGNWKEGINVLKIKNFIKDVWNNKKLINWRNKLIISSKNCNCKFSNICRSCPVYPEINSCKKEKK